MPNEKILIIVKTYPTLDLDHEEIVCTAGVREDGKWIRIHPIPFRKLDYDSRYKKYQCIRLELKKNSKDYRPESYSPVDYDKIKLEEIIGTENNWAKRKEIILRKVYTNFSKLIDEAKDKSICTSLAVFKPKQIIEFIIEEDEREWDQKKIKQIQEKGRQIDMFKSDSGPYQFVQKLPYKFSYRFNDDQNKERILMISDWEIGQLYWNCLQANQGNEFKAIDNVRKKYYDEFILTKDIYFFVGTTYMYHHLAPNPFIIIGVFYPPKTPQTELFV